MEPTLADLIEDFATDHRGRGPVIAGRGMPALTGAAVRFFGHSDLEAQAPALSVPVGPEDPFADLAGDFPATWMALSQLSRMSARVEEASYTSIRSTPPALLDANQQAHPPGVSSEAHWLTTVASGIDPRIDEPLAHLLVLPRAEVIVAEDSSQELERPIGNGAGVEHSLGVGNSASIRWYFHQ